MIITKIQTRFKNKNDFYLYNYHIVIGYILKRRNKVFHDEQY